MKPRLIYFVISVVILMVFLTTPAFSESIKWYSHEEGIANGQSEGKKIYINFRADWCGYCKVMERETFRNPAVISYLNKHFISIKVDTDKETKISNMYRVNALPDNWFLFYNGNKISIIRHIKGYIPPDPFMKILKQIQEGMGEKKEN